jgi:hypothetical protein
MGMDVGSEDDSQNLERLELRDSRDSSGACKSDIGTRPRPTPPTSPIDDPKFNNMGGRMVLNKFSDGGLVRVPEIVRFFAQLNPIKLP